MARKKKPNIIIPKFVKYSLALIVLIAVCYFIADRVRQYSLKTDFFKIRSVSIDSSLDFIDKDDVGGLIGKNIFKVDLISTHRRLSYKYPQASHLKIMRRFPDQIVVSATPRLPFAQVQVRGRMVTLDREAVILSIDEKRNAQLPEISGSKLNDPELVLGLPLDGKDVRLALKVLTLFEENEELKAYTVSGLNLENLSKIYFTLSNNIDVIVDRERIAHKIKVLGVVLANGQLDFKQVKYIDLRFKEPIIGKK